MHNLADTLWATVRTLLAGGAGRVCLVRPTDEVVARVAAGLATSDDQRLILVGGPLPPPAVQRVLGGRLSTRVLTWHDGPTLPEAEIVVLVGEPNAPFVGAALDALGRSGQPPEAVVVVGTGWPHGRRNAFPADTVVPADLHGRTRLGAVHPDHDQPVASGAYAELRHAVDEGGAGNGVLAAIEEDMAARPGTWRMIDVPTEGGLAALVHAKAHPRAEAAFAELASARFLHDRLVGAERSRVRGLVQQQPMSQDDDVAARSDAAAAVTAAEAETAALRAATDAVRTDLKAWKRRAQKAERKDADRDAALQSGKVNAASLRADLRVAVRRVDVTGAELDQARRELRASRDELSEAQASADAAAVRLKVESEEAVTALRVEHDVMVSELAETRGELLEVRERADRGQARVVALQVEHDVTVSELAETRGELSEARERADRAQARVVAVEGEAGKLAEALREVESQLAELRAQELARDHELTVAHAEIEDAVRAARERDSVNQRLKEQLEASDEGRAALRRLAADFQEEIAALTSSVATLDAAQTTLRARTKVLEDERDRTATEAAAVGRELRAAAAAAVEARTLLQRTEASTTWTLGLRLVRIGRTLALRPRPKGRSGLAIAIDLLGAEDSPGPGATGPTDAEVAPAAPSAAVDPDHGAPGLDDDDAATARQRGSRRRSSRR